MRTFVRAAVVVLLCVLLAPAASAAQLVKYKGSTSTPTWNNVLMWIDRRDDGGMHLRLFRVQLTATCEDTTTEQWVIQIGSHKRIGENGELGVEFLRPAYYFRVDGTVKWGMASGTTELNYPQLTADGQDAQLCGTGDLDWSAQRVIPEGAARSSTVPDGVGFLKLRVRHGVAEVVKLVEP